MTIKLRHFESVEAACAYVVDELIETLNYDLSLMKGDDAESYTDEDRKTMEAKIHDARAVHDLIVAAPTLIKSLRTLLSSHESAIDLICAAIDKTKG